MLKLTLTTVIFILKNAYYVIIAEQKPSCRHNRNHQKLSHKLMARDRKITALTFSLSEVF